MYTRWEEEVKSLTKGLKGNTFCWLWWYTWMYC